jgi:hypothetical protein
MDKKPALESPLDLKGARQEVTAQEDKTRTFDRGTSYLKANHMSCTRYKYQLYEQAVKLPFCFQ